MRVRAWYRRVAGVVPWLTVAVIDPVVTVVPAIVPGRTDREKTAEREHRPKGQRPARCRLLRGGKNLGRGEWTTYSG